MSAVVQAKGKRDDGWPNAKVCCVTEMILPEFQQGMGLFENFA